MSVSFWPLWLVLSFTFLFFASIWWLTVSGIFYSKHRNDVYSRGINGLSGNQVTLRCPVGKKIGVVSGYLECGDQNGLSPLCDPYNADGTPNKLTTQDISASIKSACNGNEECSYIIPYISPFTTGPCLGVTCGMSQLVGTYTCS